MRYRREIPYPGICYEQFPVSIPESLERKYADTIVSKMVELNTEYIKKNNMASDICLTTNDSSVKDLMGFWNGLMNNTIEY